MITPIQIESIAKLTNDSALSVGPKLTIVKARSNQPNRQTDAVLLRRLVIACQTRRILPHLTNQFYSL